MPGGLTIQFWGLRGPGSLLGHTWRLRFMDSLVENGKNFSFFVENLY